MKNNMLRLILHDKSAQQKISGGRSLIITLLIIFTIIGINPVLIAQVSTTYTDSLTSAQQFKRPNIAATGNILPGAWASQGTLYDYTVLKFTVTTGGLYTIETTATRFNGDQDPMLFIYTDAFDPSTPLLNGIVGNDDIVAGVQRQSRISNYNLPAGNYSLVVTVWAVGVSGGVDYKFTGPASVSIKSVPVLGSLETSVLEYYPGTAPMALSSAVAVSNRNNAPLTEATVQISANYRNNEDVLSFTNQNGISGSWNASTGTMTLTGSSSPANYQAALRSITYENVSATPNTTSRTVSYKITDGITYSSTISRSLNIVIQACNIRFNNLSGSSFTINWTPVSSGGRYLVVRRNGSAPNFIPSNGTEYNTGVQGLNTIVYVGSGSTYTETGMNVNTDYYYKIFTYQGTGGSSVYATTTSPLQGINRILDSNTGTSAVGASALVVSRQFPDKGVSVIFTGGTTGTNLTVTKMNSTPSSSSNFSVSGNLFFTVESSSPSPGVYTIVLDFSSLNFTDWSSYKVLKRADESSPWQDVTESPINAIITDRATDGVPGKFTISGLTSFSQFVLGGQNTVSPSRGIKILLPKQGDVLSAGSTETIQWMKTGFFSSVKMEYSTDNGNTWQTIKPDGKEQPLSGLSSYPWQVPTGINSSQCRIRVSNWYNSFVYGISEEPFTISDINVNQPDSGTVLNVGSIANISWTGGISASRQTKIQYSGDGGNNWNEIGQPSNPAARNIAWKIPEIQSDVCKVRVVQISNNTITGSSKGYFKIERLSGDVSGDGQLTGLDSYQIMAFMVGALNFDSKQLAAADVNGDGRITSKDVYYILYHIVYKSYPSYLNKVMASADGKIAIGKYNNNEVNEGNSGRISIPINLTEFSGEINSVDIELNIDNKYSEAAEVESSLPESWVLSHKYIDGKLKISMTGLKSLVEGTICRVVLNQKSKAGNINISGKVKLNGESEQNIGSSIGSTIPQQYSLSQNYPNPFNPSTLIKYQLPFDSNVKLNVYNSLGEQVLRLVNRMQTAGNYEVNVDASNLASGVYVYMLQATSAQNNQSYKSAMKMILIK